MTHKETPLAHDRAQYRRGCRCGECREANRQYQRQYRSKSTPFAAVPDAPADDGINRVQLRPIERRETVVEAVQRQLDELGAMECRPGIAATALRLAELLDDDRALPQYPAAAHRLIEILLGLSKDTQRRGRLAAVRDMTD